VHQLQESLFELTASAGWAGIGGQDLPQMPVAVTAGEAAESFPYQPKVEEPE